MSRMIDGDAAVRAIIEKAGFEDIGEMRRYCERSFTDGADGWVGGALMAVEMILRMQEAETEKAGG